MNVIINLVADVVGSEKFELFCLRQIERLLNTMSRFG